MVGGLLGQILVNAKLVTPGQLAKAVQIQSAAKPRRMLGEVLVEEKILDADALESILAHQARTFEIQRVQNRIPLRDLQARMQSPSMDDLLRIARELGASDLLLTSTQRPVVRLHGNLVDLPGSPLSFDRCRELLFALLSPAEIDEYGSRRSVHLAVDRPGVGRFKAGIYRHLRGIAGTFRVIPDEPWAFERLGLPVAVRRFADFGHGLVVISGPMGCGKSTTLAALLELINRSQRLHIVTLEDPIEFVFRGDRAVVTQRQIGLHASGWAEALRSVLRLDPDVIAVGRLDDPESIETALAAAETGHLVLAAMRTPNVPRTLLRLLDPFPGEKRAAVRAALASSLRAVLCQQLVPNVDGLGRSIASELLLVNAAAASLIREDRLWQLPMVMQTGAAEGMRLMDESLRELVSQRRISVEDALARATDPSSVIGR